MRLGLLLLSFVPYVCLSDVSGDPLPSWRSLVNDISASADATLSGIQSRTHDLTVSRSVSSFTTSHYDGLLDRLLAVRAAVSRISAYSAVISNRLASATYPLDDYGYDVSALSTVANSTYEDTVLSTLYYMASSLDDISGKVTNVENGLSPLGDIYSRLGDMKEIQSYIWNVIEGFGLLTSEHGVKVWLNDESIKKLEFEFEKTRQSIEGLASAISDAINEGTSSALDDFGKGIGGLLNTQIDYLYKLENQTADILSLLSDWYAWQSNISTNFVDTSQLLSQFYRSWIKTIGVNVDDISDSQALDIPIVRVWGGFGGTNSLEYVEKFYRSNYDDLSGMVKLLSGSEGRGFASVFNNSYWPYHPMSFPFIGFRDNFDDRLDATNTPFVGWSEIYATDGLSQMADIMYRNLLANANNGLLSFEILKALRGVEQDVARDEYITGLTDLENEYKSEDGWNSHFTNSIRVVESIGNKFSGRVDSSSLDTISSTFAGSQLPSVLSYKFPSFSIGNFSVETHFVSSPALGDYYWLIDGIRNCFIFLWWSGAVIFLYSLSRVLLSYFGKFIANPVSTVVQSGS